MRVRILGSRRYGATNGSYPLFIYLYSIAADIFQEVQFFTTALALKSVHSQW
jgi:hypothetical protein